MTVDVAVARPGRSGSQSSEVTMQTGVGTDCTSSD